MPFIDFIAGMGVEKFMFKTKKGKRHKMIFILLIFIVTVIFFEMSKSAIAVRYDDIDKTKEYMICRLDTAAESHFSVIYDSYGRNIRNLNLNLFEQLYKFNGEFSGDLMGSLNTFVIYGKFNYNEQTHDVVVSHFCIRPIYPVKRDAYSKSNEKMPDDCIYRYESSWVLNAIKNL